MEEASGRGSVRPAHGIAKALSCSMHRQLLPPTERPSGWVRWHSARCGSGVCDVVLIHPPGGQLTHTEPIPVHVAAGGGALFVPLQLRDLSVPRQPRQRTELRSEICSL